MTTKVTQGERLVKLETEIEYIKNTVNSVDHKLDKFIDAADKTYARKSELVALQSEISHASCNNWNWKHYLVTGSVALFALLSLIMSILSLSQGGSIIG